MKGGGVMNAKLQPLPDPDKVGRWCFVDRHNPDVPNKSDYSSSWLALLCSWLW